MCGIAGFYGYNDSSLLRKMTDLIEHRGPDEDGFYEEEGIGLGMRRLSIIDVEGGRQPVVSEDGKIQVILNGEIYNYQELRRCLEACGHRFYTNSDTETIVHLYEEYGTDFVQHLRGMFALALWDSRNRKLILVRDRVGIKPLYYYINGERLFFASELKSLLLVPGFRREIDPAAFLQFLSFLYIPAPNSVFRDVHKLPPGQILVAEGSKVECRTYWDLHFSVPKYAAEEEAAEHVHEILDEAVRMRMISDVPLGAFLSGGLDSSAIVGLMTRHSSKPVKTFSVGFSGDGQGFNELDYAREIAQHFETDHHECIVDYNVVDLLPKVLWHFDEPFGNSTSILTYLLSGFARQHVTVALSGTGGDEAFMGYPRYLGLSMGNAYGRIPAFVRKHVLARAINWLPEDVSGNFPLQRTGKRVRRFVEGMELPEEMRYISWLTYFNAEQQAKLTSWSDGQPADGFMRDHFLHYPELPSQDRAFYTDVKTFLPYNQLEYMDKMSMACSLEARVPFCDHKLLELSASLPYQWKLKGWETKRILKEACRPFLPKKIVDRRKVGFDAPTGMWFKGSLRPICESLFCKKALAQTGIFNADEVGRLMNLHLQGQRDYSLQLWMILVFEVWYRMYIVQGITEMPQFTLHELLDQQGVL